MMAMTTRSSISVKAGDNLPLVKDFTLDASML